MLYFQHLYPFSVNVYFGNYGIFPHLLLMEQTHFLSGISNPETTVSDEAFFPLSNL